MSITPPFIALRVVDRARTTAYSNPYIHSTTVYMLQNVHLTSAPVHYVTLQYTIAIALVSSYITQYGSTVYIGIAMVYPH